MKRSPGSRYGLVFVFATGALGCSAILGIEDVPDPENGTGAGATSTSTSGSTGSGGIVCGADAVVKSARVFDYAGGEGGGGFNANDRSEPAALTADLDEIYLEGTFGSEPVLFRGKRSPTMTAYSLVDVRPRLGTELEKPADPTPFEGGVFFTAGAPGSRRIHFMADPLVPVATPIDGLAVTTPIQEQPYVVRDGDGRVVLFFAAGETNATTIQRSVATTSDTFTSFTPAIEVDLGMDGADTVGDPVLTPGARVLFFRARVADESNVYRAESTDGRFGVPAKVVVDDVAGLVCPLGRPTWVSPDACALWIHCDGLPGADYALTLGAP